MGWQYNQRISEFLEVQLEKAQAIQPPQDAGKADVEAFEKQLAKGTRLLAKHAQLFDIRDFYTTADAQQGAQQICAVLREIAELWHGHEAVSIAETVPEDWVEEDRHLLQRLLNYILNGVEDEADEHVRQCWGYAKAKHEYRLKWVKVVEREEIIVGERMAQGGKGVVFRATLGGQEVAVKRPQWEQDLPLEDLAEFAREVSMHAMLNYHPNVVQLLATTSCGWLVMELAESDLHTLCRKKLAYGVKLALLQQAAAGLICMHAQNLVHGDIKSKNCLIFGEDPEHPVLRLSDLGLTFEVGQSRSKTIRRGGGTPAWIAPEIYDGRPIDKASDVYSFGVLMYELVSGKEPYGAGRNTTEYALMALKLSEAEPCQVRPQDCPKAMYDLMRRCCVIDPSKRPTMEEVGKALEQMPTDVVWEVPWEPDLAPSHTDAEWARTASDILADLKDSIAHLPPFPLPGQESDADSAGQAPGPPAPLVRRLLLDGEQGLAISSELRRVDGQVVYDLRMANETAAPMEDVAIKIMENSFGLQPVDEANRIPCIAPHSVHAVAVPLCRQPSALSEGPARDTLNVVANIGQASSLLCFQETLPVEVLFNKGAEMDPESFRGEWGKLGEERQKEQTIEATIFDLDASQAALRDANIAIVACSQIDNSDREDICSRCLVESMSAQVLLQLRFQQGILGIDCTLRSERPDLGPLVFSAVRRILSRVRQPHPGTDGSVYIEESSGQEISLSQELPVVQSEVPSSPNTARATTFDLMASATTEASPPSTDGSRTFTPTIQTSNLDSQASIYSETSGRCSNIAFPSPPQSPSPSSRRSPFMLTQYSEPLDLHLASSPPQPSPADTVGAVTRSAKSATAFRPMLPFPKPVRPDMRSTTTVEEMEPDSERELQEAAKAGLVKRVIALLEHGVNVNATGIWFAGTALRLAAVHGHVDVAEVLLDKGANINAKDRDGNTALHLAACEGQMEMVKFLLQRRANKHIRNHNGILWGDTAADVAKNEGHEKIAKFIKGWGGWRGGCVRSPVAMFRTSPRK